MEPAEARNDTLLRGKVYPLYRVRAFFNLDRRKRELECAGGRWPVYRF